MRLAVAPAGRRRRALPAAERTLGTGPEPRRRPQPRSRLFSARRLAISRIARSLRSQAEHAVPFLGKDIAVRRVVIPIGGVEQLEITQPHSGRHWWCIGAHRSVIEIWVGLIPGLTTLRHRPVNEQLGRFRMRSLADGADNQRRSRQPVGWCYEFNLG